MQQSPPTRVQNGSYSFMTQILDKICPQQSSPVVVPGHPHIHHPAPSAPPMQDPQRPIPSAPLMQDPQCPIGCHR